MIVYRTDNDDKAYKGKALFGKGMYFALEKEDAGEMMLSPDRSEMIDWDENMGGVYEYSIPDDTNIKEINIDEFSNDEMNNFYSKLDNSGAGSLKQETIKEGYDGIKILTEDWNLGGNQIVIYNPEVINRIEKMNKLKKQSQEKDLMYYTIEEALQDERKVLEFINYCKGEYGDGWKEKLKGKNDTDTKSNIRKLYKNKFGMKKQSQDEGGPIDMVGSEEEIPMDEEGDLGGGDLGGGDLGGGGLDDMGGEPGGMEEQGPPMPDIDWDNMFIEHLDDLDKMRRNDEDFDIDYSKMT